METSTNPNITEHDAFYATISRWSWETDASYAAKVERIRERAVQRVEGLERLARLLRGLDVPTPLIGGVYEADVDWEVTWWVDGVDEIRTVRRQIGTPNFGTWDKVTDGGNLKVELTVDRIRLVVAATAKTCDPVVVGREEVERNVEVCPTCDAIVDRGAGGYRCSDVACDFFRPDPVRKTRTVEQDVIKWDCPDINGDDA